MCMSVWFIHIVYIFYFCISREVYVRIFERIFEFWCISYEKPPEQPMHAVVDTLIDVVSLAYVTYGIKLAINLSSIRSNRFSRFYGMVKACQFNQIVL